MKYSTNQFKAGLKVLIENEPCSILSYEFHKPGKGQAVMRTKLYNLRTQKVWERTFKSGESVEGADIVERDFQFLYVEGQNYVFMDKDTYEQIEITADKIEKIKLVTRSETIILNSEKFDHIIVVKKPTIIPAITPSRVVLDHQSVRTKAGPNADPNPLHA